MSNLQNLLRDALLNNSYDYEAMHNTLKRTWMNSFSYLYELQKAYVEYEELIYYSNDDESRNSKKIGSLYLDKYIHANFDIDYDLIRVYDREEFRRSEFYGKKFTIQDMVNNQDIFAKIPVVIIDDKVIWDYSISITKDCTTFTLPFRRNFVLEDGRNPVTDEVIYIDHKIQVLVIENSYYNRFETNKSTLKFNATAKSIRIEKDILVQLGRTKIHSDTVSECLTKWGLKTESQMNMTQKKYCENLIQKRIKLNGIIPNKDGIMMCSIHTPNVYGKEYELGTSLITLTDMGPYYEAKLPTDMVNKIHQCNRNLYLSIFFVEGLYKHTFFDGRDFTIANGNGAYISVLQQDEMVPYKTPIPVENLMVFKTRGNSRYLEKNTSVMELHYPNIYMLNDPDMQPDDKYEVFYFYHHADDLQYTVLFDFYFTYLTKTFSGFMLEEIINKIYYNTMDYSKFNAQQIQDFEEAFEHILDYKYYNHKYGESDFLQRYLKIEGNEDKEPIEYKDETLKDWIKVQPWVLNDYVLEQKKLGSSYHLFTNTIDLKSRIRTNTHTEMEDHSRDFDEPRYVFAFNNSKDFPTLLEARVFVDGLLMGDIYQERHLFMDYFYIPCDMVTEDSYIEIEIFPSYRFKQNIMFNSLEDEKEITLVEPDDTIFPTLADIYHEDFDEQPARYDTDLFDIVAHHDRADILAKTTDPEKPVKFTRLSTFRIKPNSEDVVGVPLSLNFSKIANGMSVLVDQAGYPYLEIIETWFNFNADYIRIYRNGRLVPRSKYVFISSFNAPRIMLLDWYEVGEIIYMDITPYRYTEIYYKEELTPQDTVIDLKGIINKPFDIRYYDVYINGRKLSLNNVFSITPWSITLVNLKSNYHLQIFERERDWEYFGLDYTENIYYYSIDELFNSSFVSEDEKNQIIKDIIDKKKDHRLTINPNTNDETPLDYTDYRPYCIMHIFYFYELLPKTFVNPDVKQFNIKLITEDYNYIKETYAILDPSKFARDEVEKEIMKNDIPVLMLDPDIIYEGENPDDIEMVYPIGHLGDVEDELLSQEVVIPSDGNIK